jgi:hypothetical protein
VVAPLTHDALRLIEDGTPTATRIVARTHFLLTHIAPP